MTSRIALGTVQFGLDYGVNNAQGRVEACEVMKILGYALDHGIDTLDTAQAYGESEKVLGQFPRIKDFMIITKLKLKGGDSVREMVHRSLGHLGAGSIYGVLYHDISDFRLQPQTMDDLILLKNEGLIQKIGFSLYRPEDLTFLLNRNAKFDLIQIPYNIFDRRFEPYFNDLKTKGIEIHIRSLFLQGLFFIQSDTLPAFFAPVRSRIEKIGELAGQQGLSVAGLCLSFGLRDKRISRIVLGVDNLAHLKENVSAETRSRKLKLDRLYFNGLRVEDETILLPFNWKL